MQLLICLSSFFVKLFSSSFPHLFPARKRYDLWTKIWLMTKAKHSYVLNCESDSQPSSYAANVQKYLSFPKLWPPISSWIRPPISHVLSEKMYWQYVNGRSSGCSLKLTKSHQPICILSNLLRLFSYYQSTISQVGEKNQGHHNKKAELCFRSSDWRSG